MKTILLIISLGFLSTANAQLLTLDDAIKIALKNNLDIEIEKNNFQINKINNNIAVAGGMPNVSSSISSQQSVVDVNQKLNTGLIINRAGSLSNSTNANVSASQLLYNGSRVVTTKKRLEALQKQSEFQLNAQIQNTMALVMVKYYDVVRQQFYLNTIQQSIELSRKQKEIIETKKSVGLATDAEYFQSQIDLNTRMQDFQSQQTIVSQVKVDLLNVLNLKLDTIIVIKDSILIAEDIQLNQVLSSSNTNPEISSLDQQIKINNYLFKEMEAMRKPSLNAGAGFNYGRTQNAAGQLLLNQYYGPYLGIGLTIPIYNGGAVKRQLQSADIRTKTTVLQKEVAILNYQTAATKTFQSYISGIEQIKTQGYTFDLSSQLVALVMQKFKLASATIIEVREAQKSYEDAAFRLVNLEYLTKIAEIELRRLSNQL